MANQTITVNKKRYAVGLFWQPIGAGYVARNYARTLSRTVDKKMRLFTEFRSMVGMGSRRLGHFVGMSSAAAEVTSALGEYSSFLGVFTVGNRFYLVAVRNGIILEDKIFDTESQARAEYFRLSEIPDWAALFAPGAWGMPRAIERDLSGLITGGARAVLHSVSRLWSVLFSALLLVLFAFVILRIFGEPIEQMRDVPDVSQINPELAAEYKKQLDEKNRELDAQFEIEKTLPPPPIVLPYDNLPDPVARAQTCYQAIAFLMQPISGWVQVSAECGQTHASARFRRSFGTLGDFYAMAGELMPASFVEEVSEDVIQIRATLPLVPTIASIDERDAVTVARDVQTAFQSIDSSADTNIVVDVLTNGVDTVNLNIVEVAADSKLVPMQFMKIFDDFGGVYMTRAAWTATSRTWNYEVIIYAK